MVKFNKLGLLALYICAFELSCSSVAFTQKIENEDLIVELTDENFDQIQDGQWLIGFFDKTTKESLELEEDWREYAVNCKDQDITVGRLSGVDNPALTVRFFVTAYPAVFYIKNGIAHEIKMPTREIMIGLIQDKTWSKLLKINFLYNPFSIQMSLLSNLFLHAVNLYDYEDAIVKKFVPFSSVTDFCFGLTFIVVGTTLGLLITIAVGAFQVFFLESRSSSAKDTKKQSDESSGESESDSDSEEVKKTSEDESSVRKRK
ncbi:uncharacterized protein CDAR_505761 [Caerostris darwini]|uniref:Uncharacterized protein n=1 Tax=Caerostris darwini TaxID=1538125 RepID=A0AAV4WBS0_9ARAC|nr:uncharacterized protein CDAR_505761 [Caerostris darwini]